jgi:hypothetical protein
LPGDEQLAAKVQKRNIVRDGKGYRGKNEVERL